MTIVGVTWGAGRLDVGGGGAPSCGGSEEGRGAPAFETSGAAEGANDVDADEVFGGLSGG